MLGGGGKGGSWEGGCGGCCEWVTMRGVYPRLRGLNPWRILRYCGQTL